MLNKIKGSNAAKKIVTIVVALMMVSTIATAQTSSATIANPKCHNGNKKGTLKGINLTAEQKIAMQKINADHKTKRESLKKNDAITMGEFKAKKEALSKEHKAQVDNVLTDVQKATLAQTKANHKNGAGKKGGHQKSGDRKDRMKNVTKELGLTPAQESTLKATKEKSKVAKEAIENDANLTATQKKEKLYSLKVESKKAFEASLTTDQKAKLATMKQHKGKRKPIAK